MNQPTLHLMVGLPCSGKTTYGRKLSETAKALFLSPDEWQIALYGDDYDDPDHGRRHDTVERKMIELARQALSIGASVILDFGFWGRDERDALRRMAKAENALFKIHYMDIPLEELLRRMEARNQNLGDRCFTILPEQMLAWSDLFQRPTPEELADE